MTMEISLSQTLHNASGNVCGPVPVVEIGVELLLVGKAFLAWSVCSHMPQTEICEFHCQNYHLNIIFSHMFNRVS